MDVAEVVRAVVNVVPGQVSADALEKAISAVVNVRRGEQRRRLFEGFVLHGVSPHDAWIRAVEATAFYEEMERSERREGS